MATIREQIIEYLKQHPDGVDDDELAQALNLKRRQQANSRCRQLEKEGMVQRVKVRGKIHNFLIVTGTAFPDPEPPEKPGDRPWFWEGNVQNRVVEFLEDQGYVIRFAADTASRQAGKDIEAERDGKPLWVTVKGYPQGTARTSPTTQGRHWFKQALFDIVVWRGESEDAELALALPDYPTYRKMAEKISWFHRAANFAYFWVRESGAITVESSRLPKA